MFTPRELGIKELNAFGLWFADGERIPLRLSARDLKRLIVKANRKGITVHQYIAMIVLKDLESDDEHFL
jgi:predicted DNA binding CopG/RHH family protein